MNQLMHIPLYTSFKSLEARLWRFRIRPTKLEHWIIKEEKKKEEEEESVTSGPWWVKDGMTFNGSKDESHKSLNLAEREKQAIEGSYN